MKTLLFILTALGTGTPVVFAQLPTIISQPTSLVARPGALVRLTVAVSGTGPFAYQWQFNGTNLPSGIITTVAGNGNGQQGYSGDGGLAAR